MTGEAADTLREVMLCESNPASSRVQAAKTILEMAIRGVEVSEILTRLVMLETALWCGLRGAEIVAIRIEDLQLREEHWVIADLVGKGRHVRTVPMPAWVKNAVDEWTSAAGISEGTIFRRINREGKVSGPGLTSKAMWHVVKAAAKRGGLQNLAPHDLRRYAGWETMPSRPWDAPVNQEISGMTTRHSRRVV